MQFYGHTNRAGNLATTILQGSVDGKRERGRPRTTWLKNTVDWTGLATNDLHTGPGFQLLKNDRYAALTV